MIQEWGLLLLGMVLLIAGAEYLVRGATRIAKGFGVSTLLIGLTVVAFGTSAPELFVSLAAAVNGTADVAVGNIIGSNIFNILVIIGLTALLSPIIVSRTVKLKEMPVMLASLGAFWWFASDGEISRLEGAVLFLGILAFLIEGYLSVKRQRVLDKYMSEEAEQEAGEEAQTLPRSLMLVLIGLVGLMVGANWIVENATIIAKAFGVSDFVIAVTLVAVGTSLPELATTVIAAIKNEPELVIGNAIGSNIFNVLCVIGATGTITPLAVSDLALSFDFVFMFFGCALVWPFMVARKSLSRLEGALMLIAYLAYIVIVVTREGAGV